MSNLKPAIALANAFSAEVRASFTAEEMAEIRARNRKPEYAGACATHDFADANMIMAAAWQKVFKAECDPSDDGHAALWNRAWDIARENEFTV